jgi:NTF2 fold immunity protein
MVDANAVEESQCMRRTFAAVLLFTIVALGKVQPHPDYVPDEKTAERIAEAILLSQFGQERVGGQLPLRAVSTSKALWLVQGASHDPHGPGGNFGVWINKHSGCVSVIEHMK